MCSSKRVIFIHVLKNELDCISQYFKWSMEDDRELPAYEIELPLSRNPLTISYELLE